MNDLNEILRNVSKALSFYSSTNNYRMMNILMARRIEIKKQIEKQIEKI